MAKKVSKIPAGTAERMSATPDDFEFDPPKPDILAKIRKLVTGK